MLLIHLFFHSVSLLPITKSRSVLPLLQFFLNLKIVHYFFLLSFDHIITTLNSPSSAASRGCSLFSALDSQTRTRFSTLL
ncbi:hypothetical protein Hanom_Chr17g01561911 [Helianthus anomalus]